MLSKYMCIPFYYNEGYGLGDITSDEDDSKAVLNTQLESNSIVPLRKYYRASKSNPDEQKKLNSSTISSTDIFKNNSNGNSNNSSTHQSVILDSNQSLIINEKNSNNNILNNNNNTTTTTTAATANNSIIGNINSNSNSNTICSNLNQHFLSSSFNSSKTDQQNSTSSTASFKSSTTLSTGSVNITSSSNRANSILSLTFKKLTFNHNNNNNNNESTTNEDSQDLNNIKTYANSEKKSIVQFQTNYQKEDDSTEKSNSDSNHILIDKNSNNNTNKTSQSSANNNNNNHSCSSNAINVISLDSNSSTHTINNNNNNNNNTTTNNNSNLDENENRKSNPSLNGSNRTEKKLSYKDKFSTKSKRLKRMISKASKSQSPSEANEENRRQYFLNTLFTSTDNSQLTKMDDKIGGKNMLLAPRKQSHLALSLDTYKRVISQKLSKERAIELDDSFLTINSVSSSSRSGSRIVHCVTAPNSTQNTPIPIRRLTKQPSIIDSSLLTISNSGRVCLRLMWDKTTHVLTVAIIQSNKLLTSDKSKLYSKIQFHLTILNKEKSPKYKTTTKEYHDILNFNENFYFPNVEKEDLENYSILMSLYGKETFGSDKLLSQALYCLNNLNINEQFNYITLYFEEPKKYKSDSTQNLSDGNSTNSAPSVTNLKIPNEKPELLIGLKYDALLGNLLVKIIKGNNLLDRNSPDKSPNTFVRVILHVDNNETKFQTSLKRSSPNPIFDESFEFSLATYQVENAKLFINIYSKRLLSSKSLIGCIVFDDQPAHNEYVSHLRAAITSDDEVQKWHPLIFY